MHGSSALAVTSYVLAGMLSVNGTVDTTLLALTGTQGEGGIESID